MADGNPIGGLYPQPPQPGANALNLPALLQAASFANQNALFQREFNAKQAVGRAVQGAIRPDGSFDPAAATAAIAANPDAAYAAPEAVGTLLDQRGKQIANSTAAFGLAAGQSHAVLDTLGAAADSGDPDAARKAAVTLSATTGIPSSILTGWLAGLPSDPAARARALQTLRTVAMGSTAAAGRTAGPVAPATLPDGTPNPNAGAPSSISVGQSNEMSARVPLPPSRPTNLTGAPAPQAANPYGGVPQGVIYTGLPPGVGESKTAAGSATGTASAAQGTSLQAAADNAPNRKAAIANLGKSLDSFESGPMAPALRTFKAAINQAAAVGGVAPVFDPKSLGAQEEFDKISTTLAQQQAALGGATDARLDAALHSNPSSILSKPGNRMVLQVLNGNEDAIAVKSQAWQEYRQTHGDDSYGQFSTQFNKTFNPRVFQFPYMNTQERGEMLKSMTPSERGQVLDAVRQAEKNGWIKAQ